MTASSGRPGLDGRCPDLRERGAVLLGEHLRRQPAVALAAGDPEHPRLVGGDPDRRAARRVRREPEHGVLERVELALEVDGALGAPQQAHHVERLVEVADRLVPLHPVRLDVQLLAAAEPEDRATLRDVVEREGGLGEHGGVVREDVRDDHADADLLRDSARDAHHHERVEVGVRIRLELRERSDVLRPHRLRMPAHQMARPPDRLVPVGLRSSCELDRLVGGRHDRAGCSEFDLHQLFTPASRLHIPSGSMSSRSSPHLLGRRGRRLRHVAVRDEKLEAGRLLHLLDGRARMHRDAAAFAWSRARSRARRGS